MSWLQKAGFPATPGAVRASEAGQGEWVPNVWKEYVQNGPTGNRLPDFSRAGYAMGDKPLPDVPGPVFDVAASRFGAVPDDGKDDTAAIQAAIDAAGATGGGVVFLPSGRYEVHPTVNAPFLCIANSHVILRGQGSGPDG
ncbi:MAG: glycosyl hydrolase family 28-related protein, partial [Desulfobacterales bacterium]